MNKKISLIYRAFLVLIGLYGLYLNFFNGYSNIGEMLHYYTILSNILVIGFFIFLIINYKKNKDYPHLKGAVTMAITVTFLIFHFILNPAMFDMIGTGYNPLNPSNLIVHYIVPIMAILDWLLFDIKGRYTKTDPLLWLSIPFIYFIVMTINGLLGYTFTGGSHYPYFFMDWDKLGAVKVLEYVLLIIVAFTILGYIYYGIDRLLKKKK